MASLLLRATNHEVYLRCCFILLRIYVARLNLLKTCCSYLFLGVSVKRTWGFRKRGLLLLRSLGGEWVVFLSGLMACAIPHY